MGKLLHQRLDVSWFLGSVDVVWAHLWVWLDRNTWMNCRCSGRQLLVVEKLVTHGVPRRSMKTARIARFLAFPPDVKRPSRVTRTMSKSLEELAREVARAQGQPAGKEEDSETCDESGPLPVPSSARVVSGRRHHRLRRRNVGRVALGAKSFKDPRSVMELSHCSWLVPQVGAEAHASSFLEWRRGGEWKKISHRSAH